MNDEKTYCDGWFDVVSNFEIDNEKKEEIVKRQELSKMVRNFYDEKEQADKREKEKADNDKKAIIEMIGALLKKLEAL